MKKEDIKDELCTCGGLKSEHESREFNGFEIPNCMGLRRTGCIKFTWKDFILNEGF